MKCAYVGICLSNTECIKKTVRIPVSINFPVRIYKNVCMYECFHLILKKLKLTSYVLTSPNSTNLNICSHES